MYGHANSLLCRATSARYASTMRSSILYWEREKSGQENQRGGSALNGSSPVFEQQFDALAEEAQQDLALDPLVQAGDAVPLERLPEHVQQVAVHRSAGRSFELESRLGEDERVRETGRECAGECAAEEGLGRSRVVAMFCRDQRALERGKDVEGDGRVDRLYPFD